MQSRILAGVKRLMMALAIASLIVAPAGAATTASKGKPGGATSLTPGVAGAAGAESSSKSEGPILYQRAKYAWPFGAGPVYGQLDASSWNAPGVLHTQVGSFDLTRGMPTLPNELRGSNRLAAQGAQYFLLQVKPAAFANGAFDEMKRAITAQGGAIVGEIPVAAFVVRMTPGAFAGLHSSGEVIALEPYPPAFKIEPSIGRVPLPDALKAVSSVYSLTVRLFPGESLEAASAALTALGGKITSGFGNTIHVDIDHSKLGSIANMESVFMINEDLPLYQWSEEITTTIQTGRWNNGTSPYVSAGVDGGGLDKVSKGDDQLLMIIDNGLQIDAAELSDTRASAGVDVSGAPIAGHRKVAFYGTTIPFGGNGDLLGCDGATTSGFTHGNAVADVALGNATTVPASYGAGWQAVDGGGNPWSLDGVAPKARLIAYDAQVTPLTGSCSDPTQGNLTPGDLYISPSGGALGDGYTKGARVVNFSWGSAANLYDANALDIDQFLVDHTDAAVFVAAGNTGSDLNRDRIPDPNTIGAPATAKNIIAVGCSYTSDDQGDPDLPNGRWSRSSNGPATSASGRIAPLLLAPGTDAGSTGLASTFNCRTLDNDQNTPVECDVITAVSGLSATSYASAAAAGAGLLVRDYFAQGFYPDGTNANTGNAADKVATISGDLLKTVLVASADWMNQPGTVSSQTPTNDPWGDTADFYAFKGNLTRKFRGNREQGFGRIQLTNVLPLQSYPGTVSGLIVDDGSLAAIAGTAVHSTTLNTKIDPGLDSRTCSLSPTTSCTSDADCTGLGTCVPYTFNVCDTSQPLTVVIAWSDPSITDSIARDLDLTLTSPSGRKYIGNFFTDDINDNAAIDSGEECTYSGCPWPANSAAGLVDTGPWSLPTATGGGCTVTCTAVANHVDHANNVEAIFLSPDSRLNGIYDDPATSATNEASDNQIEQGTWSVLVNAAGTNSGAQTYSIAISGGVCLGSSARVQKVLPNNQLGGTSLACNDSAVLTIDEIGTTADPVGTLTNAEIASRTKAEVLDTNGNVVDTETFAATDFPGPFTVTGNNLRADSNKILLTEGTAFDSGNHVLDVRDGYTVRVTYQDESPNGTTDPNAKRTGSASVVCKPAVASGGVLFGQWGRNALSLIEGGCEKDIRGYFSFGFPDRYMDAGEVVSYTVAFQSAELGATLTNVSISLRAVLVDTDSPANCKPGTVPTASCPDPNRTNNPSASALLTVLDSPKVYGSLPSGQVLTPSFTIQMAPSITGTQKVDMLIGVTSKSAGKSGESLIAKRETLNADASALYYSTDFPTGGVEAVGGYDVDNNEILEPVIFDPTPYFSGGLSGSVYEVETRVYSNMTANPSNALGLIQAPWNFDSCSTGGKCNPGADGFVSGVNNTQRPSPGTYAQWGEDINYNGRLDGYCTLDTTIPCTQGIAISENCKRCTGNKGRECQLDSDCSAFSEGTCTGRGTCNFTLGEDRDPVNSALDVAWNTAGGCGWQTKAAAATTGGVWHTGLIRDLSTTVCLAASTNPSRCQSYETPPDNDLAGDNEWWEQLLTPVLNKVNQGVDAFGDPLYQIQITDWAWNMLVDLPDGNTRFRWTFDTDINKVQGVDLYNSVGFFNSFGGNQGAVSGGNAPITGGYNMFAQISHCEDTDGNGSPDHCGTAAGTLCGSDPTNVDLECTGFDLEIDRGRCSIPPVQKKCTGNMANCTADATCPTNERCVTDWKVCSSNLPCGAGEGVCDTTITGVNRNGKNSCYFEGKLGSGLAKAQETYGLATPKDDDRFNGYCNRSDSLNGIDKAKSCTVSQGVSTSFDSCTTLGAPYTTCNLTDPNKATGIDQYVQNNGPGRNFGIRYSNGPDMAYTTLEDFYGDTGNQFRGSVSLFTREATSTTPSGFTGFGASIDDMVVSWKETTLVPDSGTHCSSGGVCATLETATGTGGTSYDGNGLLTLTLNDPSPYEAANPKNDCNGDGDYTDAALHCWKPNATTGSNLSCSTVGAVCTARACTANNTISCTSDADCTGNGTCSSGEVCFAPDSTDCNLNGTPDVTVKITTDAPGETAGEIAVLDKVGATTIYKTSFPYSTLYDSPGTLFVVQSGTQAPLVRALYTDRDDGTGSKCKNDLDPSRQGFVEADTSVQITTGRITVNSYAANNVSLCSLTVGTTNKQCVTNADCVQATEGLCNSCSLLLTKPCNPGATSGTFACLSGQGVCTSTVGRGDPDGFADTNETIALAVSFANKSGVDVSDLTATLGTSSPNIECISRSVINVGALANGAVSNTANYPAFQFKVANVNRTSVAQTLDATFTITMRSNKFDALTRSTTLKLDLDLNAAGTATTSAFLEDFEASGFGKFTLDTIDANKRSIAASAGYRCQYNDPFGLNSYSIGEAECFLGFTTDPVAGYNSWHIHKSTDGGMGRAYTGKQSLHWGEHLSAASPTLDTYKFKQLDAIKTINPINLPLGAANPELTFMQQVSFIDNASSVNVTLGESPDRGVVEVQAAATGVPQGAWIKIYPYVNVYDTQGTNDFSNCIYDPIDDGNDEKSFFDPTDPLRRYGPSSTCYPEFNFVRQGQTDYRKTFDVNDISLSSDGPGLQGCSGPGCLPANTPTVMSNPGTWVQPKFQLSAFAGKTIRLRFIATTIEISTTQTANLFFGRGDIPYDDGWFIDNIHIDQALLSALTLSADTATITPIPCASCSNLATALAATPASLSGPGQVVTLDAKNSSVTNCLNGVIQYQFWIDSNGNSTVGDAGDTLLRDWSDSSTYLDAPTSAGVSVPYGVKSRCSTNLSCGGTTQAVASVSVACPTTGSAKAQFTQSINVAKGSLGGTEPDASTTVSWASSAQVDIIRGNLFLLRSLNSFTGSLSPCLANNTTGTSVPDTTDPGVGGGFYFLLRPAAAQFCNQTALSYGLATDAKERAGRDTQIAADGNTCP